MNEKEARKPGIIEKNDVRLGFLGYCKKGEYTATDSTSGAALFDEEIIKEDIRSIKNKVDFVVLSLHWGIELSEYPSPEQVEMAHRLVDAGAEVIIGHHPHVLQGIERYKRGLIFYSLGNFIFDNYAGKVVYKRMWEKRKQGIVAVIHLEKENLPTYLSCIAFLRE